ncbi:MAG: T9SS type A sorting domain-containing protein [Bacteroidetes bacterium]|nr:T9SS type A sorting domain-containing protein [Bacteroidota bacterium]
MRYKKLKASSVVILLLGIGSLHAQDATSESGGNATGVGGTYSYMVGQLVYTTNTGINGSVAQGVLQPYEISTVLGVDMDEINLELIVYPNPTTNYLTLKIDDSKYSTINFQLIDMQGKLLRKGKMITNSTTIKIEDLPQSTYFLNVTDNNKIVKTFKIIKN